jgi:ribosome recycling factor
MMGLVHDVGKIGIPDAVINKPGKLTDEEYEMKSDEVDKLTNQEVGEILENSLYTYAGDIQKYFDDFLDKHDEIMTDKFNEYIS